MTKTDLLTAFAGIGIDISRVSEIETDQNEIRLKSYFGPDGKLDCDPATGDPRMFTSVIHFDQ